MRYYILIIVCILIINRWKLVKIMLDIRVTDLNGTT
jgi:hypothetical protein